MFQLHKHTLVLAAACIILCVIAEIFVHRHIGIPFAHLGCVHYLPDLTDGKQAAPEECWLYDSTDLHGFLKALGPNGRHAYLLGMWTFDLLLPLSYGTLILGLIGRATPSVYRKPLSFLQWTGVAAALADLSENILTSMAATHFENGYAPYENFAHYASLAKWLLLWSSMGILFIAGSIRIFSK